MISLSLVVFLSQLMIHLVNTVGATAINELLWVLYNRFPTPTAKDAHDVTRSRREVVRMKRESASVSAQDEFSKWAKLRRQHDKVVAEHDKSAQAIQATKAKFDSTASTLRWLSTTGLRFLSQFWYSKQPLFWIPQGWVPGYVEWIMAFPRAPAGSISIQIWGIACASVIQMVSEAVVALYASAKVDKQPQAKKGEPMAFKADFQSEKKES